MEKETFTQFCRDASINYERADFHAFVREQMKTPEFLPIEPMLTNAWFALWNQFIGQPSDDQDLNDTQADCLGVPF